LEPDLDPLRGLAWNEAAPPIELEAALFSIIARDFSGELHVLGTGFIFKSFGDHALACSAAHVFSEVRRLQSGGRLHGHPSALPEFLPPPRPIDLKLKELLAITTVGERLVVSAINGLVFDEATDVAVLQLRPQPGSPTDALPKEFLLDERLPTVGTKVCVLSYADQRCVDQEGLSFLMKRRATMRIGKVLGVFPDGERLCRGPCIETSIPVFHGMSGGPVLYFDSLGAMRVFGFVCADPDEDGPSKQDRSVAGRSLVAKVPCKSVTHTEDGKREIELELHNRAGAGEFRFPRSEVQVGVHRN
jgi:Trypsin-like peptidase domain